VTEGQLVENGEQSVSWEYGKFKRCPPSFEIQKDYQQENHFEIFKANDLDKIQLITYRGHGKKGTQEFMR
jgi:hypothetical protein